VASEQQAWTDYASLRRLILHDYSIDSEDEYEQVRELLAERDRLREALEAMLPGGNIGSERDYLTNPQYHACIHIAREALSRPQSDGCRTCHRPWPECEC
jgi:hypothetical protein